MIINTTKGSTPIEPEESCDLIPNISTREELNELESENILSALIWAKSSRKLKQELLSISGLKLLHKKMFCEVWSWAGTFRITEKNIGNVLAHHVQEEMKKLCDDTTYQIDRHKNSWSPQEWHEATVLFHHRLVLIHPFPNGNGRHARLASDLLLLYNKQPPLTWGENTEDFRKKYLEALREADKGTTQPLIKFCTE